VSGQPGTAFDNSVINWILAAIIFVRLAKQHGLPDIATFDGFMENVRTSIYGDDIMFTMSARCLPWFTRRRYAEEAAKLGFTMTSADKVTPLDDIQISLDEMTFLKRGFRKIANQWVGPIEQSSIAKSCHWIRQPGAYMPSGGMFGEAFFLEATQGAIIRENLIQQLVELSLHGEPKFEEVREEINAKIAKKYDFAPILLSYQGALAAAGVISYEQFAPMWESKTADPFFYRADCSTTADLIEQKEIAKQTGDVNNGKNCRRYLYGKCKSKKCSFVHDEGLRAEIKRRAKQESAPRQKEKMNKSNSFLTTPFHEIVASLPSEPTKHTYATKSEDEQQYSEVSDHGWSPWSGPDGDDGCEWADHCLSDARASD
jgi:hypothetical protein